MGELYVTTRPTGGRFAPIGMAMEIVCEDLRRVLLRLVSVAREHNRVDAKLEAEVEVVLNHIQAMLPRHSHTPAEDSPCTSDKPR